MLRVPARFQAGSAGTATPDPTGTDDWLRILLAGQRARVNHLSGAIAPGQAIALGDGSGLVSIEAGAAELVDQAGQRLHMATGQGSNERPRTASPGGAAAAACWQIFALGEDQ